MARHGRSMSMALMATLAVMLAACSAAVEPPPAAVVATHPGALDRFGVACLYPTRAGGREWFASWDDGHPREFDDAVDPRDPWFDTDHGHGHYAIDGKGTLTATGNTVRMYVHDPQKEFEWGENLEITVYVTRVDEARLISYSGVQIFARTNHGTTASDETKALCDCRGYGAKANVRGQFAFEKEIRHGGPAGDDTVASTRPWKEWPRETTVGFKYILRNVDHDTHVRLELYRDTSNGQDRGDPASWQKLCDFTDTGANFGVGKTPAKPGLDPALPLIRSLLLKDSESGKPTISVYYRHEFGTMRYEKASIRQIDPL